MNRDTPGFDLLPAWFTERELARFAGKDRKSVRTLLRGAGVRARPGRGGGRPVYWLRDIDAALPEFAESLAVRQYHLARLDLRGKLE